MADEERLLRRLKRGDTAALDDIITKYSRYVGSVILNQLGDRATIEDAEELASDVFCSLWEHRQGLRTDNLRGWLAACARNQALSFLRKRRFDTVDADDCIIIDENDLQDKMETAEKESFLRDALSLLDSQSREIFIRHFYYNQTVADISAQMSLGLSNVKSRLQRGKQRLRDALARGGYCREDRDKGYV